MGKGGTRYANKPTVPERPLEGNPVQVQTSVRSNSLSNGKGKSEGKGKFPSTGLSNRSGDRQSEILEKPAKPLPVTPRSGEESLKLVKQLSTSNVFDLNDPDTSGNEGQDDI